MMMRLKFLNKSLLWILAVTLVFVVCGCEAIDTQTGLSARNYTVMFKNSSDYRTVDGFIFPWSDSLSFNIIEVWYMDLDMWNSSDMETIRTINDEIRHEMTSWINGKILNASEVDIYLFCKSERYLSFCNSFEFVSSRTEHIRDFITIDMQTGRRVMIDDLIEINEDFVRYIQTSHIAQDSRPPYKDHITAEGVWDTLNSFNSRELLAKLEECSLTQQEVIGTGKYGYFSLEESLDALTNRWSFFVQENTVTIVYHHGGEHYITLDLYDIEEYLKVDKW